MTEDKQNEINRTIRSDEIQQKSSLKSGHLIHHDFRPSHSQPNETQPTTTLRFVQWNIERGYKLAQIIETLERLDADVICLQELDIHCERSAWKDVGVEIAKKLKMNYYFVCEFEELHSPIREKHVQGGGYHGNAILSKYEVVNARAISHKYQPFHWENQGHSKNEPRKGERYSLAVVVKSPVGQILCYSAHLEVFCGILGRVSQFSEILEDARKHLNVCPHQVIMGDLNTMAHSIARLSPNYCTDHMRWRSLGKSEAEWWQDNVLDFHDSDGPTNTNLANLGLPDEVLRFARNPGFVDPFDLHKDFTLHNPNYFGVFKGKLDWLLLRGFNVISKDLGNHNFSASDHKYLVADVTLVDLSEDHDHLTREYHQQHKKNRTRVTNGVVAALFLMLLLCFIYILILFVLFS